MYHDVSYLLSRLINGPLSLRQIYFASSNGPVPDLAYQVDFPRLEIVLEGEFVDTGAGATLVPGDVLYVAAGGWNFPQWQAPATTFSVALFWQKCKCKQHVVAASTAAINEMQATEARLSTNQSVAQAFYISPNYL